MSKRAPIIASLVILAVAIVAAVILVFTHARPTSALDTCMDNLRMLDSIKQQWALEYRKSTNDTPSWEDLRPYLPDWTTNSIGWTNRRPICPKGGTYTLGRVGVPPTCSMGGIFSRHALSDSH